MIYRDVTPALREALKDSPVVLLHGARQTGKSTLVQWLAANEYPAHYLTLDDATLLAASSADPTGFLTAWEGPLVIDEVQRVPALFMAIKKEVDSHRAKGRFLLTGSANVLLLPRISESLAGRMEILTLWPLSQGEISGIRDPFIDKLFAGSPIKAKSTNESRSLLFQRMLKGGFPEVLSRISENRRAAWFGSYLTTILQRDIRDMANIEALNLLPRLLSLLAGRATKLLNFSEISRDISIPQTTLKRYMGLLEASFLILTLPAWSANIGTRQMKTPKLLFSDTGVLIHLLGLTSEDLHVRQNLVGPLIEDFVAREIVKQISCSKTRT